MKRGDIWAALALLAVAGGLLLLRGLPAGQPVAVLTAQGKSQTLTLDNDLKLEPVSGVVFEIHSGQARIAASPCRDQLCVHAGWLSKPGEAAVCLPEKVVLEIRGTNRVSGVDGVAG